MTRDEKEALINSLSEKIKSSPNFYITDISTMTVENTSKLRRELFKNNISMQMAKNTLIHKALERSGRECSELYDVLKGSSSIMFSETANAPAKVIKEFRKKNEKPILKGAFVGESVYLGDASLTALASLKSKNELIGDIIMLLQSPAKNVVGALQSGKSKLAGIVKTLSDKEDKS